MSQLEDPPAFHPPEEENVEEVEAALEEGALRSHLVVREDGSYSEQIEVGLFDFGIEVGEVSEVILVADHEGKLVVAVPEQVWNRAAARRVLPQRCLIKPVLVSVTSGPRESVLRGEMVTEEEVINMRIWIGMLDPKYEEQIGFGEEADPVHRFGLADNPFLPLGQSLWEVVNDQFSFRSAESGPGGSKKEKAEDRLRRLEESMMAMQQSLEKIASGAAGSSNVEKAAKKKEKGRVAGRKEQDFEGLDANVVQSALTAGVPAAHLKEMSGILKGKPKRLEELPRKPRAAAENPLGEDLALIEVGEEEEGSEEEGEGGSGESGMEKAIIQLTKIASHLTEAKKKDPLEVLLDGGSGSLGGSESSSSVSTKKNAAALRALQRCLKESPKTIYQSLEANLQSDFLSRPVSPGEPMISGTTARGWLTSKSRVMLYQNHVRWVWQVGGIWDCLMMGRHEEARARAGLLVAAADQASIDGGSWLISTAGLLEQPPPYQMFAHHQAPSHFEAQHTALYDPRWMEVFMSHVKDLDSYQEARRKLGRGPKKEEEDPKPTGGPKLKGKGDKPPKSKGKGQLEEAAQ